MRSAAEEPVVEDDGLVSIGREVEHLLRYRAEVDRRLARSGVGSMGDLLRLHQTLRRAFDALSRQELEWTLERVRRLLARLQIQADQLERVRALKRQLDA